MLIRYSTRKSTISFLDGDLNLIQQIIEKHALLVVGNEFGICLVTKVSQWRRKPGPARVGDVEVVSGHFRHKGASWPKKTESTNRSKIGEEHTS